MLKLNLTDRSRLLIKKLVIVTAIFGIAKPVAVDASFFGDFCNNAFEAASSAACTIYNGAATLFKAANEARKTAKKAIKIAKISGLCLAGLLFYKAMVKPAANTFLGTRGRKITAAADNGIKWSFFAAKLAIPAAIVIWLLNNQQKLSKQISNLKKDLSDELRKTENNLSGQIGELNKNIENNHVASMNELSGVKKDTKESKADLKEVLGLLMRKKVLKNQAQLNPAQENIANTEENAGENSGSNNQVN